MTKKVLCDVDPGSDDAVMLAMGLGHDAIDIVGITTVAGNSTIENTTTNAASILTLTGETDIPIARGCARPIVDSLETAEHVHGANGIRGELPSPIVEPIETPAATFIVEQARRHGDELTILAVGPLTNIATALSLEPDLPAMVDDIIVMGGAAFVSGNVTASAEANFANDPIAAERVVQDGHPRIVGLDVTLEATLSPEDLPDTQAFSAPRSWLTYPEGSDAPIGSRGHSVHDAVVLANHIDPSIVSFVEYPATVDTSHGPSRGALICDGRPGVDATVSIPVATSIDVERFRSVATGALHACFEAT